MIGWCASAAVFWPAARPLGCARLRASNAGIFLGFAIGAACLAFHVDDAQGSRNTR